jgi:hypothetical protein
MLELLPPENFELGCFRCCEYWTGTWACHYIKRGNAYYSAVRKATRGWTKYRAELETQLRENNNAN